MGLLLQAVDVAGPLRWRWLLTDEETGAPLADQPVDLDPGSDEVAAFADLFSYAYRHAVPDRRAADMARIVAEAGEWAGRALLGEKAGAAILEAAPVTIRVVAEAAPGDPLPVLAWPLELAHAGGRPLAAHGGVTFIYEFGRGRGAPKPAAAGPLRVLAVFSQPTRTSVLALRRERYALSRLIRRIAARQRRLVELRVVQYGATRQKLAEIADDGNGWDVLHLSGHGTQGLFLLERADGSPDPVGTGELIALLRPLRRRVKLAVASACESAAETTARALRLIGLPGQAEQLEAEAAQETSVAGASGLARALVTELDCAVVAMRYPVVDEFAIAFGDALYERLLSRDQSADVAVAGALAEASGLGGVAVRPAPGRGGPVALATPGLFGARAAGLRLAVPRGRPVMDPAEAAMAYFPAEPERFAGRAGEMVRASAALAPGSGRTGVLLHGMSGAGKTACALELAYRHQDSFAAAAFWQAPAQDDEFGGALADLAIALENQLGDYGFTMTGHIGTPMALEAFLPRLRRLLEDTGLLLVLDNLETLLTPDGTWRDPRWGPLVAALTGHGGESRVALTSRVVPAGLDASVLGVAVHALPLPEAVAMARELPHLRALLHDDDLPVRADAVDQDQDRDRVRRVLHIVQGHPKLLELADAAAGDRDRLDGQLAAAEAAAAGQGLEAFFRNGTSTLDPGQFLAALSGWTAGALAVLPEAARLLAGFVACLEDGDRQSGIIGVTWPALWQQLDQPGDPPAPGPLLETLTAAALVQAEIAAAPGGRGETASSSGAAAGGSAVFYRMHPGVATAVIAAAPGGVRGAADAALGAFWEAVASQAREREGREDSGLIVHAGLAAVPYLLRVGDWDTAGGLLEQALYRDGSPGTVAAALPALRQVAAAAGTLEADGRLARALRAVDPDQARRLLRGALDRTAAARDDRAASVIASDLINVLVAAGRLAEALELAGQMAEHTRRAGLGPWTQLLDEVQRVRILGLMGEHEQVLAETEALRARMAGLPDRPGPGEAAVPWNVREGMLGTGHGSALALGRWQQCLDLNAEITASVQQRDAGEHELARTRASDVGPLVELGRLDEAGQLLQWCQHVFEEYHDTTHLARVLGTRAGLEATLGRPQAAAGLARTALRLGYARPDPGDLATSHHNLASYLRAAGGNRAGQRAHRLAAVLLSWLAGMTHNLASTMRALVGELRDDTASAEPLPGTVAEVVTVAEQTEGVRLGDLLAALEPDAQAVEAALAGILRAAAAEPPAEDPARPGTAGA